MSRSEVGKALSEILLGGVDVHRCAAARAIGKIADWQSVDALKNALLDEDPDVRADAAAALGEIITADCPADVADALMENLLGDPDSDVKMAAISTLARMRHAPLVPVLRNLVVSRAGEIVWDEDEFYTDGWDSWLDIQLKAIAALGELGIEEAVPEIVCALGDEMGQDVSETAVIALARLGQPGADALADLFSRGDVRLNRRVAGAVRASANPHLEALRDRCLADESAQVRLIAAAGLAQEVPGDPRLEPLFGDVDAGIRAAMVKHAGFRYPDAVANLLGDPDAGVRSASFRVVADHPDLFAEAGLADTVRAAISGDPGVATQAALAWVALVGEDALAALGAALGNPEVPLAFRIGSIGSLQKIGRAAVPCLLGVAGDEDRQLRLAALTALADFAANDAIWPNPAGDGLLAALRGELVPQPEEPPEETDTGEADPETDVSPDPEDISEELESAPLVPEGGATSTLDAILSGPVDKAPDAADDTAPPDPIELSEQELRMLEMSKQRALRKRKVSPETIVAAHLDVPRFAARLLGGVVHPDVTAHLVEVLGGDDEELLNAALHALVQHAEMRGTLLEAARAPLLRCIDGEKADLRLLAVRALGWLDNDGIDEILGNLLSDSDLHIRLEAVRALDLRGVADDRILACLKDEYSGVRLAAATALARHRGADAVEPLVEFALADDGTYRREVGRMLGVSAREPAARSFLRILGDERHKRNWLVAIEALGEMFQQPDPPEELKVA